MRPKGAGLLPEVLEWAVCEMEIRDWLKRLFPPETKAERPLTPRLARLLTMSREIAGAEPQNAHHLAAALLRFNEGCAVEVLKRLGITLEQIVSAAAAKGSKAPSIEEVLTTADLERKQMQHRYLGTEHLLLALVQRCHEVQVLFEDRGVVLAAARQEVLKELDPNFRLPD